MARAVTGLPLGTSGDALLAELGWLPLATRGDIVAVRQLHKITTLPPTHRLHKQYLRCHRMTTRFYRNTLAKWGGISDDDVAATFGDPDASKRLGRALRRYHCRLADGALATSPHHSATILSRCKPDRTHNYSHNKFGRDVQSTAKLRCGFSLLNADRHHEDDGIDPTCPHCGLASETAEHFLAECAHWDRQRATMNARLNAAIHQPRLAAPLPWTTLLGGRELTGDAATLAVIAETVQRYVRDTGRLRKPR